MAKKPGFGEQIARDTVKGAEAIAKNTDRLKDMMDRTASPADKAAAAAKKNEKNK